MVLATSHLEKVLPIVDLIFLMHFLPSMNLLSFKQICSLKLPPGLPLHDCPLAPKTMLQQELRWLNSKEGKSCASSCVEWKHMISWRSQDCRN